MKKNSFPVFYTNIKKRKRVKNDSLKIKLNKKINKSLTFKQCKYTQADKKIKYTENALAIRKIIKKN